VWRETVELGFPYTPTLLCKRQRTTIIVDVVTAVSTSRLVPWVAYAKSSGKDTRIALCLPERSERDTAAEAWLRQQGVGLYLVGPAGLVEIIAPADLGLAIQLPSLDSLPRKLQKALGSAYDQFQRSHWREGFEDACQVLETEARRYLKTGCRSGRIIILSKKGPMVLSSSKIEKLTLGQLAGTYSNIQNQNYADSIIGQTLDKVNDDRVGVVHHKAKVRTETRLRRNVGQHMWAIVSALRHLLA
jgi:hypothetical protein